MLKNIFIKIFKWIRDVWRHLIIYCNRSGSSNTSHRYHRHNKRKGRIIRDLIILFSLLFSLLDRRTIVGQIFVSIAITLTIITIIHDLRGGERDSIEALFRERE